MDCERSRHRRAGKMPEQTAHRQAANCEYVRLQYITDASQTAHRQAANCEYVRLHYWCIGHATDNFEAALSDDFTDTDMHYCGMLIFWCKHCNAKFFVEERLTNSSATNARFRLCCGDGKVKLWTITDPREPLVTMMVDTRSSRTISDNDGGHLGMLSTIPVRCQTL